MAQFLRVNGNKTDLFNFLADKIAERCQGTVVIVTREEGAVSNQLISLEGIAPCNHEEADSLTFCSFHRIEQNICLVGTSINKGCAVYYYSVVMHRLRIIRSL